MSSADALASLRDIHYPLPITWWPLAPGWFALIGVLLLVVIGLLSGRYYYRLKRPQREALRLLMTYEKAFQEGASLSVVCANVAELLRRVALVYFPREQLAGLQGEAWLAFLNETSGLKRSAPGLRKKVFLIAGVSTKKNIDFTPVRPFLLEYPYQSHFSSERPAELMLLFQLARLWIKQRSGPCSN